MTVVSCTLQILEGWAKMAFQCVDDLMRLDHGGGNTHQYRNANALLVSRYNRVLSSCRDTVHTSHALSNPLLACVYNGVFSFIMIVSSVVALSDVNIHVPGSIQLLLGSASLASDCAHFLPLQA
jgi:hypothetical protein